MIKIKSSSKKFNKKKIEEFENRIGVSFPKEYIKYLEKYNGGLPEENLVISEGAPPFILTSFFGTGLVSVDDLFACYTIFNGRIPKGCIPIARDAGGNIICLNLNEDKYGYLYFWDHEKELMIDEKENLYFIASSFNQFLDIIKPHIIEDDDLSSYEVEEVWIDPDFLKELKNNE